MKSSAMYLFILIFLCNEYQVMSGNEKEADSKLSVHISIKKRVNNSNIERKVVKGGYITVKFETDFYVEEAGLLESNNKSPRWAPNSKKIPNLEIGKSHTEIILDFKGPVTEKHTTFKLIILSEQKYCHDKKKSAICNYNYNGKSYLQRIYTVIFRVTDYIKLTANGNELKAYSMSGDIPSNMVFLYELKYRPGDYNIAFNYLDEEDVTAKWSINGKQPALSQDFSKTVKLNKSLLIDDNGKTFDCVFTHEDKVNVSAKITYKYVPVTALLNVQVNGKVLKDLISSGDHGDYRVYYNNDDTLDIDCIPNMDVCRKDRCEVALCVPFLPSSAKSDACDIASKMVSKNVTLKKEDDGALVNCSYTSEVFRGIETALSINFELIQRNTEISLEIDGKIYKENETFQYDMETVSVQCSSSRTIGDSYTPKMELILYQNKFNNVIDHKKLLKNGYKMEISFEHSATLHDGDTIGCHLKEIVVKKNQKPMEFGFVTINVKKKEIPTTTPSSTTLPDSAPDSPGGNLNTDIAEQSKVSSGQNSGILSESWFIYVIISCAVIVIIIIIVCIVKVSRRKPRDAEQLVPAEYETLNDTPPPPNFPQNARLEETYCKPADSKSTEPTYAQPYVPKSPEELYSKPVPKNARKKAAKDDPYASLAFENAYAKVKPKSERNRQTEEPGYAEVGKYDEPTYASVQQYANLNKSAEATNKEEYYNVFNNSSYANSKQNGEYVEPSYCEVSKLKK